MKKKVTRYISLVLLIFWMCIIFFFSNQSAEVSDNTSDGLLQIVISRIYPGFNSFGKEEKQAIIENFSAPFRKAAHFTEFFVLGAISFVYFTTFKFNKKKLYLAAPFFLGFLYAVSDEVHQLLISGRACRILDVYIDSAGVLFAVLFFYLTFLRGDKIG